MTHPLIIGLFATTSGAATAARELRTLGIPQERVSIVARTHDEEGSLARASGATPGSELEDSRSAGRLGELSAHLLAAVAVGLPGIGPIVADGPLAAGFGEAAGHIGGRIVGTLEAAGIPAVDAERFERQIIEGSILVGAHVDSTHLAQAREVLTRSGATKVVEGVWRER